MHQLDFWYINLLWSSDVIWRAYNWGNIVSRSSSLPDSTKSLHIWMLTVHQWGSLALIWKQFYNNCFGWHRPQKCFKVMHWKKLIHLPGSNIKMTCVFKGGCAWAVEDVFIWNICEETTYIINKMLSIGNIQRHPTNDAPIYVTVYDTQLQITVVKSTITEFWMYCQ